MSLRGKKSRNLVWIGSFIAVGALLIATAASWLLYQYTIELFTENLRERLLSISITQAANIRPEAVNALRTERDWQKPEWREVVSSLKRAKDSNEDIVFMYIFRKKPGNPDFMEFVADAESIDPYANTDGDPSNDVDANNDGTVEPDGADKLQWPGQDYLEAVDIPETYEAYNGPLTARELYEDSYGQVLTGYAPIRDRNGDVIAVLATDIKAGDFFTVTRQTLYPFLIFIAFLVLVIAVLSAALIYIWGKHAGALARLSSQLESANVRLRELDKLKSEFVSIASHQLRSPLAAVKGYASMLLEGSFGRLSVGAHEAVGRIFSSSTLMARSVEDFLNVSRIELGRMKYDLSEFDMCKLVENVIDEQRPLAEDKKLKLKFFKDETITTCDVLADIGKIKQVLTNFIDNAIKYTPHGTVTVTFSRDTKRGMTRVGVTDTGIGMSQETIKKLFAKFARADNANKVNVIGTGLGLFVAKQLVEAHGGRVWAESPGDGKGSTFFFEIPFQARGEAVNSATLDSVKPPEPAK